MRTALAAGLLAAATLAACRRPQPSPEYREASQRHAELLAAWPLDAYSHPEMAAVLDLLDRVPSDSLDAEPAADLRRKIEGERRTLAEEQARRERLVAGAGAAPPPVPFGGDGGGGGGGGGAEAAAPGPGAAETSPGGPGQTAAEGGALPARPASGLSAGTALAEFEKAHGACFAARAPARIGRPDGKAVEGVAWALRDDPGCRKAYPAEVDRVVLFADGVLLEVRDAREAKTVPSSGTVKGVLRPDGTVGLAPGAQLPPGATVKWQQPPAAPPPAGRKK